MSPLRAMGADLSEFQDHFNFRNNLDFVIMRAAVGTTPDARFQAYQPEAHKLPVRGAYHYLTSAKPWQDQLQAFQTAIHGADLHFIALDFEAKHNTFGRGFARATLNWLEAAQAQISLPLFVYTNPDNWKVGLWPFLSTAERAELAAYELWIAQWANFPDEAAARDFRTPGMAEGMKHWTFWQFSGDAVTHPQRGAEFGVDSDFIDLDIYNGTREQLIQRFAGQVVVTPPVVTPPVVTPPVVTPPVVTPPVVTPPVVTPPVVTPPVATPPVATPPVVTPALTNQDMLNAFFHAAAALGIAPGDRFGLVHRAGLDAMAIPDSNRALPYTGPAVADIPNLTDAERAALSTALGQ